MKTAAKKRELAENDSEDETAPTRALTPVVTIRAVTVTPDRRQDMNGYALAPHNLMLVDTIMNNEQLTYEGSKNRHALKSVQRRIRE